MRRGAAWFLGSMKNGEGTSYRYPPPPGVKESVRKRWREKRLRVLLCARCLLGVEKEGSQQVVGRAGTHGRRGCVGVLTQSSQRPRRRGTRDVERLGGSGKTAAMAM